MISKKAGLITGIIIFIAVLAIALFLIFSNSNNNETTQEQNTTSTSLATSTTTPDVTVPNVVTRDDPQNGTQRIDGVDIPNTVTNYIATQYGQYYIDDVDVETRDGSVVYEIELEHQDPANDTEVDLYYDQDWNLISTRIDD